MICMYLCRDDPIATTVSEDLMEKSHAYKEDVPLCRCGKCPAVATISKCCRNERKADEIFQGYLIISSPNNKSKCR